MKRLTAAVVAVLMIWAAGGACFAGDQESYRVERNMDDIPVIIDVLIMRPVGVAACIVGLVAALIAMPFAVPSGSTDKVYRALIEDPFNYTFKRPIGKSTVMQDR